ncbi:magnesium and cobalt transport protein CorA [Ancylomarina euxinus]|uniref:Magnesium transport protein CorA n=1 Tax=Ancylomarina euxinus TaxID=2283627 RepID=A0A425XXS3_9BACT|nr:magnesium/cobalt transporter CorA [Ancylomarina euxinus]MCZ4696015.1 magnesium/cobalt transporter CorA [Ancylomarina euxinus]MUP13954.1 magnesium/cobalt transporter CorA [Ancylomarina euxinus]RRG19510.1 magnesium and cobalt transport protein CorA [Ancylomarina euxinus]
MARFIKTKKDTIGLSPYAIHFRGDKKSDFIRLRLIDFNSEKLNELEVDRVGEVLDYANSKTTSWFNVDGLHDEKIMQEISSGFKLDTLIIPDVLNTHARSKIHEYDNCIYISLKMLQYHQSNDLISAENFVLIIKENILLSFQEKVGDVFEPIRERLRKSKKRIRNSGSDYLAFAILDIIIDNYIYIISLVGEKIESLDDELIKNPSKKTLEEINKYKGEINFLRKSIKPCREMILSLAKMDSELLNENLSVHLKELQDNINLANDSLDSYREILSDQLSIFHTSVSNTLNDILKFLTIFSVIFIPLTFIAGIYGTNFDNIPELHYEYGYFVMWGVIIVTAISMILYFKQKKWF